MFLKVSRNYTLGPYDYEPDLTDRATDFASMVSTNATSLAGRLSGAAVPSGSQSTETPPSLSHAFAKTAYNSATLVGEQEPFSAALKKFAGAQERMGNFRLQQV